MQTSTTMTTSPDELALAIDLLRRAQRVIVVCHYDPDGDAIGTLLGLGWALRGMGKEVTLACDDPVPWNLTFLPGSETAVNRLPSVQADLVVIVDCSDARRAGKVGADAAALGVPVINIDHHVTNTRFGQVNIVEPDAVAASAIVFDLLKAMGYALDPNTATCLLTGLVTDTHGFRTANVNQGVLLAVTHLMDAGASLTEVTRLALDRHSFSGLAMIGKALNQVQCEDGVIWSYMTHPERRSLDVKGTGARPRNFSTLLNTVEGVSVAAFFLEDPANHVDISMRAKPGFDLSVLFDEGQVLHKQGGGHPLASGAEVDAPLEVVVTRVVDALKALVKQQKSESRIQSPESR